MESKSLIFHFLFSLFIPIIIMNFSFIIITITKYFNSRHFYFSILLFQYFFFIHFNLSILISIFANLNFNSIYYFYFNYFNSDSSFYLFIILKFNYCFYSQQFLFLDLPFSIKLKYYY
jgi:hypothetical protein